MADYIKTNEIQTRISLKYDSFATWQSKNPKLLKGEVAIATVEKNTTTTPQMQNLPNVVIKVGDGINVYNELPFVSALAADVYEWAKAANKPSYSIGEISNALEYRLVAIDAAKHQYALQARKVDGTGDWANVSGSNFDIDLSQLVSDVADHKSRIGVIEGDLNTAETGLKARMTAAEQAISDITKAEGGAIGEAINSKIQALDSTKTQAAAEANGQLALEIVQADGVITSISGSIAANTYDAHGAAAAVEARLTNGAIKTNADNIVVIQGNDKTSSMREVATDVVTTAIDALDVTKTQAAGNDGLALEIVQENGVIKSISGSIAAETYDAHGSAAAVKKELTEGVINTNAEAIKTINGSDTGKSMREVATAVVETLDYNAYEAGNAEGTTISFVGTVSEDNGVISATKRDLVFTDSYSANNPAATKKYVDDTVTSSVADLTGAMHFEGVKETLPSLEGEHGYVNGDVIIVGITEYVYSNGAWVQLGDEGALGAALNALTLEETGAVDKTLVISQSNGKVSAKAESIQIAQSQVTNLTTDLAAKLNESVFSNFKADEFTPVADDVNTLKANAETTGSVAHSIATALSNLTQDEVGSATQTLKVKQENGKVTAEAIAIAIEQSQVNGLPGALEAKLNASDFSDFKTKEFAPVKTAVDNMATTIAGQINALDANLTKTTGNLTLTLTQVDGIVTAIDGSIADVYEAKGAAAAVQGDTTHTVAEAYALADAAQTADEVSTAINNKVATLAKEDTAVEGEFVTATSQANGVISVSRAKVNVKHLAQDANTYVLFNCGTAEINI